MDAQTRAEIERKARAGIPLAGDQNGHVSAENLAYWQSQITARAAQQTADTSYQSTGSGVGTVNTGVRGNINLPDVTASTVKGYGFTAIVGVGVAMVVMSLLFGFRRVRGR